MYAQWDKVPFNFLLSDSPFPSSSSLLVPAPAPACCCCCCCFSCICAPQILRLVSKDPEAMNFPWGWTATQSTDLSWPLQAFMASIELLDTFQRYSITIWSWEQLTKVPSWSSREIQATSRTGPPCPGRKRKQRHWINCYNCTKNTDYQEFNHWYVLTGDLSPSVSCAFSCKFCITKYTEPGINWH